MYRAKVIKGDGIGKKLGWPTANLDMPLERVSFVDGIYAGEVMYDGQTYGAAVVIDREVNKLEAHILDFDGDCYGKELVLHIYDHVSTVENIGGQDLLEKIAADVEQVKNILQDRNA